MHEFRVEQVLWGVAAFAVAAAYGVLRAVTSSGGTLSSLLLCLVAFALGVIGRDSYLSSQVKTRERRILAEFPTIAELLALAVAAGESPVAALDRVCLRSGGELSRDLAKVLAAVRTGEPVGPAFDAWAASTGQPLVARFAQGIAVAVERGTPLADVLHAQASDVREAGPPRADRDRSPQGSLHDGSGGVPGAAGHCVLRLLARRRRAQPHDPMTTPHENGDTRCISSP